MECPCGVQVGVRCSREVQVKVWCSHGMQVEVGCSRGVQEEVCSYGVVPVDMRCSPWVCCSRGVQVEVGCSRGVQVKVGSATNHDPFWFPACWLLFFCRRTAEAAAEITSRKGIKPSATKLKLNAMLFGRSTSRLHGSSVR